MNIDLSNKHAVITGSTLGIGFAIAKGLAESGARVVINGRSEAAVKKAKEKLQAEVKGAQVDTVAADLSTAEGANKLLRAVPQTDILINNVGIFEPKPFEEISDAEWQHFFDINVMSGIRLSRAYMGGMRKKNWGRIVFISSESAINIPVEMIQYGMTKTAQLAISRGLAETLAGTGVTVNAVLPGPTRSEGVTEFVAKMTPDVPQAQREKEFMAKNRPTSVVQRFLDPVEIANMVVYICSPQASATTGATLRVEGGLLRNMA
jgi:NAD(P)-dependent dehydrogenase (short-subunit alcohol dehydrogenase family)